MYKKFLYKIIEEDMNIEKSIIANKKLIKNIFQITIPAVFDLLAQTLIMAF